MKTIHQHITRLLDENRKLLALTGRYERNLRNHSSPEVLNTQARQIRRCESRIARLYALIRISR